MKKKDENDQKEGPSPLSHALPLPPHFYFFPFFQSFSLSYLNALRVVVGGNNNSHHCHDFSLWAINFKLQQKGGHHPPLPLFLVVTQKEKGRIFYLPFVVIFVMGAHQ